VLIVGLLTNQAFRKRYKSALPPKWKLFETLVARLHLQQLSPLLEAASLNKSLEQARLADVRWNVRMRGRRTGRLRQVDVSLIISTGPYRLFLAIECRDKKVALRDVEAFRTTLEDIGADKGILATSHGFDQGAIAAATAHGIDLLLVTQDTPRLSTVTRPALAPALDQIVDMGFESDVELLPPPAAPRDLTLVTSAGRRNFGAFLLELLRSKEPKPGHLPPAIQHFFPEGAQIELPDGQLIPIRSFWFRFTLKKERILTALTIPERSSEYSLKSLLSGTVTTVPGSGVPLAVPRRLEQGHFYVNWHCQRYYCQRSEGDAVTFILLDDKQHDRRLTVTMTADHRVSALYFPIHDKRVLTELQDFVRSSKLDETA
jgi:hypothetical protein